MRADGAKRAPENMTFSDIHISGQLAPGKRKGKKSRFAAWGEFLHAKAKRDFIYGSQKSKTSGSAISLLFR